MSLITNLDHFMDSNVALPKPARELFEFLTSIVSIVSSDIDEPIICTAVKCREPQCIGEIEAWYVDNDSIEWACDECNENGIISNWRGSQWDNHSKTLH